MGFHEGSSDMTPKDSRPRLPTSSKGAYPFTLATTSFIYPDLYTFNVRMLAPCVDEVELLFFDSTYPGSLPPKTEIDDLVRLAREYDVTYNIHLPTDVSLTASAPEDRETAVTNIREVLHRTGPLHPSSAVLHLPMEAMFPGIAGLNPGPEAGGKGLPEFLIPWRTPERSPWRPSIILWNGPCRSSRNSICRSAWTSATCCFSDSIRSTFSNATPTGSPSSTSTGFGTEKIISPSIA
jgi:hypothetical protein